MRLKYKLLSPHLVKGMCGIKILPIPCNFWTFGRSGLLVAEHSNFELLESKTNMLIYIILNLFLNYHFFSLAI